MRRWTLAVILVLAACSSKPAGPQPSVAGEALKAFGLVGVFAADCNSPLETAGRITYVVPATGDPTVLSEIGTVQTTYRVSAAVPIGNDAIHTSIEMTRQTGLNGDSAAATAGGRFEQIFAAADGGVRLQQSQIVDGPTLVKDGAYVGTNPPAPTPVMHKCQ
jgi:hypothetical protein